MAEKYQKKIGLAILFIFFLCAGFFYLSIHAVSAKLEINYPTIAGENINTDSALTLPKYVLYLFNAGMFIGFLAVFISLIISGVMYVLSSINAGLLSDAKDRIYGAISGLLILVLSYLVITTINPQLSFLNMNKLAPVTMPAARQSPGVSFYNSADCSDINTPINTTSIPDFDALKKGDIKGIKIVQGGAGSSYISILYSKTDFWGRCLYVDPTVKDCQNTGAFASKISSASIHTYDFHPEDNNPKDGGVYFYRKSYFNEQGGYYLVPNSKINGIYMHALGDPNDPLQFTGVPKEEQDCIKYDSNGNCTGRKPPSLAGENISSVKIKGNYLVIFYYRSPKNTGAGPWTSCQEFPTSEDINKSGPQQMKWQNIRNDNGVIPNYVLIIPIKN